MRDGVRGVGGREEEPLVGRLMRSGDGHGDRSGGEGGGDGLRRLRDVKVVVVGFARSGVKLVELVAVETREGHVESGRGEDRG